MNPIKGLGFRGLMAQLLQEDGVPRPQVKRFM